MAAFYLDEDVAIRLARLLADRGHVVAATEQERRKGAPDAWLTWSHAWGVARRHSGILVLPHVIAADLPLVAAAVHHLASRPDTLLDATLNEWDPATGWRRWPR